jgi:GAF domain-containing protein
VAIELHDTDAFVRSPATDNHFLLEVIQTVASTLDLDEVLRGIVGLLTEAAAAHACYIFLADERSQMVLRACSAPYAAHIGKAAIGPGEGIAGWVARTRQPVFITQDAASDPRMKVFPEFEEDKYQSLVSVPLIAKNGSVLGVVALHAEAPHEYSGDDAKVLIASASLVAGAIENAQVYAQSERRVRLLEQLFELSESISQAETLDQLLPAVARRVGPLLGAAGCEMYLLDADPTRLRLRASTAEPPGPRTIGLQDIGVALAVSRTRGPDAANAALSDTVVSGEGSRAPLLHVPLLVAGELLGVMIVRGSEGHRFTAEQRDLAATAVSHAALAVKKIQLVERLSERNLTKDFLDDLERGISAETAEARARRLRCDLSQPRVVLIGGAGVGREPEDWATPFEAALAAAFRGALIERSDVGLRALVPCAQTGDGDVRERVRAVQCAHAPGAVIGLSSPCRGVETYPTGFEEARQALQGARVVGSGCGVVAYEELGPYKYLLRLANEHAGRDHHRDALRPLLEYDRLHRSQLFRTLEEYLAQRGKVAATAARLYVHPNTLRQRLARIEALTGLQLESEDALTIEMAMKLLKLEEVLGRSS